MIDLDLSAIALKLRSTDGKTTVFDPIRRKWLILTPEEHVRQYIVGYLTGVLRYPASLIAVEKSIQVGARNKRFDAVVYDREHKPWMLIECKAPEIEISEKTLEQLLNYQRTMQCSYWALTNGRQTFCADACDVEDIKWLTSFPPYDL